LLQEFLKSDHWLRRYCILSCGVFYFEPLCIHSSSDAVECWLAVWKYVVFRVPVTGSRSRGIVHRQSLWLADICHPY